MNNDKNKNINKIIPSFSWGGTTKKWDCEASKLVKYIYNENGDKKFTQNNKHYYIKDQK